MFTGWHKTQLCFFLKYLKTLPFGLLLYREDTSYYFNGGWISWLHI